MMESAGSGSVSRGRLRFRRLVGALAVVAVIAGPACSEDDSAATGDEGAGDPEVVGAADPGTPTGVSEERADALLPEALDATPIVVADEKRFRPPDLAVPAGEEIEIVFKNVDEGVGHSLTMELPGGDRSTPVIVGDDVTTLAFAAPPLGAYRFVCEVYPEMEGTLRVAGAGGEPFV